MDHILGHKTSLNEFKRMEIISSIFSNHSSIKLEINYKKKTAKTTNTWRLNNMLLKNNRSLEKSEEIKKYLETNEKENKHNNSNSMGHNNSSCKKELYNNISLPQETRKISYKQHKITPKATRERRTNKSQS